MRKFTITFLALALASCANAAKKAEADCICAGADGLTDGKLTRLVLGNDKFVDLNFEPSHAGIFVGNSNVLGATIAKSATKIQLVLQPLKAGSTNLTVMDSKGEIKYQMQYQVTSTDLVDLGNQLSDLLKDIPSAKVKVMKDHVVIDGDMLATAPLGRIAAITTDRRYSDYVLNLARLSPQFFVDLAAKANEEIKKQFPNASVRAVNNQLWLEGKVESIDQSNRAARIASLLLPEALPGDPLLKQADAEALPARPVVQNLLTVGK